MIDLDKFDTVQRADTGVECILNDVKTGKPTDAVIVLRGMDGEFFANLKAERARDIAQRMERGGGELTTTEKDQLNCDMLSKLTVSWKGLGRAGSEIPFSTKAAYDLYLGFPAIREQVNVFVGTRSNFLLA